MSPASNFTAGRCIHCNYQLQRLREPRCPECGNDFDPADDATINFGRELTPATRWALAPAGRIMSAVLVAATCAGVWFCRLPPTLNDRTAINGWLLVAVGGIWSTWPLVLLVVVRQNRWRTTWFTQGRRPSAWPGVFAAAVGVAILFNIPRRIAFRVSEPAMNRVAAQMIALHKSALKDQRIGVFAARSILPIPDGAIFSTTRDGQGESGFIYLPKVDPAQAAWNSRTYVADGWWTWREMR